VDENPDYADFTALEYGRISRLRCMKASILPPQTKGIETVRLSHVVQGLE